MKFDVGDVVTRDGTDRQKILEINDAGDLIHVECIKEPSEPWCKIGETEWNLSRRYSYAEELTIERAEKITEDGIRILQEMMLKPLPPMFHEFKAEATKNLTYEEVRGVDLVQPTTGQRSMIIYLWKFEVPIILMDDEPAFKVMTEKIGSDPQWSTKVRFEYS